MGDLHRHGTDGVAWLSCSHVFHADCIGAHPACHLLGPYIVCQQGKLSRG
jgi:hypothetical protein